MLFSNQKSEPKQRGYYESNGMCQNEGNSQNQLSVILTFHAFEGLCILSKL